MSAYAALVSIRDALKGLDGVKSCKIGMEANITPDDYPLVRIVPSVLRDAVPRGIGDDTEALIYFGIPLHEFEGGLEAVYEAMLPFRDTLLEAARKANSVAAVVHVETLLDEDRVEALKLLAIKVRIVG